MSRVLGRDHLQGQGEGSRVLPPPRVCSRVERQQDVQVSRLWRRRMNSFGGKKSDSCAVLPDGFHCGAFPKYIRFSPLI